MTGRGRPEVGPIVTFRMPADMLAHLDRVAAAWGRTRAEMVREVLAAGLAEWPLGVEEGS